MITSSLTALTLGLAFQVQGVPEPSADSLLTLLRGGGYVLMLRHTHTDRSFQEPMGYVGTDRARQRNLSEQGVSEARMIGAVMKRFSVPFGEIVSSPMYRTVETAEYAFGKPDTTMRLRDFDPSPEQVALIGREAPRATNRVIVTHHFIIERYVPGIKPGDIIEGEAVVVRARADRTLELIGRFKLDDWRRLAPAGFATATAPAPSPALAAPAPAQAHSAPEAGAFPVVRLTSAYLRAFNSGNPDTMKVFLESWMMLDPNRPTAARVESYKAMFAQHGPMQVISHGALSRAELRVSVRTRQGDFTLIARPDSAHTEMARSITLTSTGGGHP